MVALEPRKILSSASARPLLNSYRRFTRDRDHDRQSDRFLCDPLPRDHDHCFLPRGRHDCALTIVRGRGHGCDRHRYTYVPSKW